MTAKRTIVGSMRPDGTRDQLPMGPEAVERAARMCRVWRERSPYLASYRAFVANGLDDDDSKVVSDTAGWIPRELRS